MVNSSIVLGLLYFLIFSSLLNGLVTIAYAYTRLLPEQVSTSSRGRKDIPGIPSSITFATIRGFKPNHLFCRINGACRVGDGTVMLPRWMRKHTERLANCGLKNISFSIVDVQNGTRFEPPGVWTTTSEGQVFTDDFRDKDLLGIAVPTVEKPLLATYLAPVIHTLDIFNRPQNYANIVDSNCFSENGQVCGREKNEQPRVNAILLVDSRIADSKDFHWPKSILRLLRSSLDARFEYRDLRTVYSWRVRSQASCFRSIITTNVQTSDMPPSSVATDHPFFLKNRLKRSSARHGLHALGQCIVKVLILNRYGQRFIEGANTLQAAISLYGRQVTEHASHVLVQPEVLFFENSSFHEQVSIIQEADVIVASHGENNANFMFARQDTQVFELIPFGYHSDVYKNLSSVYGATYRMVVAQPDAQVFAACVRHFNPEATEGRHAFLGQWLRQAQRFRSDTITRGKNIDSDYIVPNIHNLEHLQECAAYQRISVDVRDLARSVVLSAARLCPIQADLSFLQ